MHSLSRLSTVFHPQTDGQTNDKTSPSSNTFDHKSNSQRLMKNSTNTFHISPGELTQQLRGKKSGSHTIERSGMLEELDKSGVTQGIPIDELKEGLFPPTL
jgi:hypothetical protein